MRTYLNILFTSLAIILASSNSQASNHSTFSTFVEYIKEMNDNKQPLTLMVGCGHGSVYTDGDHTHPDCWCVNLEKDPSLKGFASNEPQAFKQEVQYDEVLDITRDHIPVINRATGEVLSVRDHIADGKTRTIVGYKNEFDVVVLERPLATTLNKVWTLWNGIHMLKIGGKLIIDSTDGYNSDLYVKESSFKKAVCSPTNQKYPVNQDWTELEKFGIIQKDVVRDNPDMEGISNYLAYWGLTDIINIGEKHMLWRYGGYQPYTKVPGGDLKTARKTCILSATKTQETENKMEDWARAIQSVQGFRAISIDLSSASFPRQALGPKVQTEEKKAEIARVQPAMTIIKPPVQITQEDPKYNATQPIVPLAKPTREVQNVKPNFSSACRDIDIPSYRGYRQLKWPSPERIKEQLIKGSPVVNKWGDLFYVQSILGGFTGFSPKAIEEGFELELKGIQLLSSHLVGVYNVVFKDFKTPLFIKLSTTYPEYMFPGAIVLKDTPRVFLKLDKIMVPVLR